MFWAFRYLWEEGGVPGELWVTVFKGMQSHPVTVSGEPFKQDCQEHPEGACCFHMPVLSLDSVSCCTLTACPGFTLCKIGVLKLSSALRMSSKGGAHTRWGVSGGD